MSVKPRQTAFVTGSTGFIGQRLCAGLVDAGFTVRGLVRTPSKAAALASIGVELVPGDVMSPESYADALDGVDVVFHLAGVLKAPWRRSFALVNGQGPARVAAACASRPSPPALVLVSSLAATGPALGGTPRDESMPPQPISAYGRAKLAGEKGLEAYAAKLPISVLRPPMVFGADDTATLDLFRLADRGLGVLPTRRESRLSLIHVDDVVTALLALGTGTSGRPPGSIRAYFIGADEQPTFSDLAQRMARACGHPRVRIVGVPRGVTFMAALVSHGIARFLDRPAILNLDKYREAVAGDWTCSAERLRKELDWRPAHTLDFRLEQTVRGYRNRGLLKKRQSIE